MEATMQTVPSVSLLLALASPQNQSTITSNQSRIITTTPASHGAVIDFNLSHPNFALSYTALGSSQTLFLGGLPTIFPVAAVIDRVYLFSLLEQALPSLQRPVVWFSASPPLNPTLSLIRLVALLIPDESR
jgi:hypothetical protein